MKWGGDGRLKGAEAVNGGTFQNVRSWRRYRFHLESRQPMASIKTLEGQLYFTPILRPYSKMCLVISRRYLFDLYADNLCPWMLPSVSLSSPLHINFQCSFHQTLPSRASQTGTICFLNHESWEVKIQHHAQRFCCVWLQIQGQEWLIPQAGAGGDVGETANKLWSLECPPNIPVYLKSQNATYLERRSLWMWVVWVISD